MADQNQSVAQQFVNKLQSKQEEDAWAYQAKIDEMLSEQRFQFASSTLVSIYNYIEDTGRITEGQKRAVDNIHGSKR